MSNSSSQYSVTPCVICGGRQYSFRKILWDDLTDAWGLSEEEVGYIDRQQGAECLKCKNSFRAIALAAAIMSAQNFRGRFFRFLLSPRTWILRILEINEAGSLTRYLARLPRRTLATYPEVDMQNMPYRSNSFDIVIHSDTLEHIPDPIQALSECRRVLKPGGFCCFTIPVIVGRCSKSRKGLRESFHGGEHDQSSDYVVQTEYGSDFWIQLFKAGFDECRIVRFEFPSALAIVAKAPTHGFGRKDS